MYNAVGVMKIGLRSVPAMWRSSMASMARPIGTALQGLPVAPVRVWEERTDHDIPLGSLIGEESVVVVEDGLELHVSTDPAERADEQDITLLFLHGSLENLHFWHYQRIAFRGGVRSVYYDARAHGRTAVGPQPITLELLADDLRHVVDATPGRLVLMGHSMGGMTILAFARRHPEVFRDRVVGVGLVSTSANMVDYDIGLRRFGSALWKVAPVPIERSLERQAIRSGFMRFRGLIGAMEAEAIREAAFGGRVDPDVLAFTVEMFGQSRMDTTGNLLTLFGRHDVTEALEAMQDVEAAVITGDRDRILQVDHSAAIARGLPNALFSVVPRGGHLLAIEHPEVVTPHLVGLVQRVRYRLVIEEYEASEKEQHTTRQKGQKKPQNKQRGPRR